MNIYKTTNLSSGKFYIGKDSKDRSDYLGSGKYLKNSIQKYGKENFQKESIAWCYTKEHLNFLEKFYIGFFNAKTPNGYNLTDGGEGLLNPSAEIRKKMSEVQIGKHLSEETRKKISEVRKGKSLSKEHCRKLSEAGKKQKIIFGRYHSEETRKKISKSNKGKHPFSGMEGKRHSFETRNKMSIASKGKSKSKEACKNMSEARKGTKFINGHFLHIKEL